MMEEVAMLVKDYGIQTVMLVWFMFRTEKAIDNNTKAMVEVKATLEGCKNHGK